MPQQGGRAAGRQGAHRSTSRVDRAAEVSWMGSCVFSSGSTSGTMPACKAVKPSGSPSRRLYAHCHPTNLQHQTAGSAVPPLRRKKPRMLRRSKRNSHISQVVVHANRHGQGQAVGKRRANPPNLQQQGSSTQDWQRVQGEGAVCSNHAGRVSCGCSCRLSIHWQPRQQRGCAHRARLQQAPHVAPIPAGAAVPLPQIKVKYLQ